MFSELANRLRNQTVTLLCEAIHRADQTKQVRVAHVVMPPQPAVEIPDVGDLRAFYAHFGSIAFYHDPLSGDVGRVLAPVTAWPELREGLWGWLDPLDDEARAEILPLWIDTACVMGETPQSGNYLMVPTEGPEAGQVFEFDHDGYLFTPEAASLQAYVERLLKPDSATLTALATHMRFVGPDDTCQWWIREWRDEAGHVVATQR
ncbi:MAG: hypothetical protein ACO1RX_20520 [Candidatus Sericytochromatia bacterium]